MDERALPTGVVTFFFTDIEGSTHLLQQLGHLYVEALDTHYRALRDAVEAHDGCEVDSSGDALFVAFADAGAALTAALDAQLALGRVTWPGGRELRVRIGVHTGEAVLRDRRYVGLAVHQAARICAAGHGGQVLFSEATRHAAAALPPGAVVTELGHHRLKDLPDAVALHQLGHPQLKRDFPGLRVDATPGNLPKQITSFVGREGERRRAADALAGGARLLTLTGPGGCGKTRLAVQIAGDVVDRYPHGAWVVDLASVTDHDAVAPTLARALHVGEEPGRAIIDTLLHRVGEQEMLLILDNCEHLVTTCAELADTLLRACPALHILATSQEALGLIGETVLRVPPLAERDAVRLFLERAEQRQAGFGISSANEDAVNQICRRLDGIPLAIELAAARIPVLTPAQIAARLDDQFRLLTGGSRGALPRQQTLRAAVDWSVSLLSEAERVLLRRLAVFSGGWTIDAAAAVAAGDAFGDLDELDVLDLLDRLVGRSLAVAEEQDNVARYRLLESIRQYAHELLTAAGEVVQCRQAHLHWFHALAVAAETQLTGPDQADWLRRLAEEHDNLRAAMEWCASHPAGADRLLTLTTALWRFWLVRGHWQEGRTWLGRALRITHGETAVIRARALSAAGALAAEEGDHDAAGALLREGLELWEELGDSEGVAKSFNHLGNLARVRGEYDTARDLLSRALELRREAGNQRGVAVSLHNLGMVAAVDRDLERARTMYADALPVARSLGDKRLIAAITHALSSVAMGDADAEGARTLAGEGLALARELGDRLAVARHLVVLAAVSAAEGDDPGTESLFDEALALWHSLGRADGVAWAHTTMGDLTLAVGDFDRARIHLEHALGRWRTLADDAAVTRALNLCGWTATMQGELETARPWLDESLQGARTADDDPQLASTLHSLGELHRLSGDTGAADRALQESLLLAEASGWRHLLWWPTLGRAALCRQQQDLDGAAAWLDRAVALVPRLGHRARRADCFDEQALLAAARRDPAAAREALRRADELRRHGLRRAPVVERALRDALDSLG